MTTETTVLVTEQLSEEVFYEVLVLAGQEIHRYKPWSTSYAFDIREGGDVRKVVTFLKANGVGHVVETITRTGWRP